MKGRLFIVFSMCFSVFAFSMFTDFTVDFTVDKDIPSVYDGVLISPGFITSPAGGRKLLESHLTRQFNAYLLLLKKYAEVDRRSFDFDHEAMSRELGYDSTSLFNDLGNRGFIRQEEGFIKLNARDIKDRDGNFIIIPFEYWEGGYGRSLSPRAKYAYLISLYEVSRSNTFPFWVQDVESIRKNYGIEKELFLRGMKELKKNGIIAFGRKKNVYRMVLLGEIARPYNIKKVHKTGEEWRELLTLEQYRVTRKKGREAPFTGKYCSHAEKGFYRCSTCGFNLFSSEAKHALRTGWAGFWAPVDENNVEEKVALGFDMKKVEVSCWRCGAHLGYVFNDSRSPTKKRYSIDSVALDFSDDYL